MLLEAHQVVPGLWQGSMPPIGDFLEKEGFTTLILCARELQPSSELYPGVQVIHAPNDDDPTNRPLDKAKLRVAAQAAQAASEAMKRGGKVLVTCAAGANRSGLVSGITLHLLYGWSGQKAVAQIRRTRRVPGGYQALRNEEFVKALVRLKETRSL